MRKLTRNAQISLFTILFLVFLAVSLVLLLPVLKDNQNNDKKEDEYEITLVAENQKLVSTYVDSISKDNASIIDKAYEVEILKGTKIGKWGMSQDQTFIKYLKLEGPNGKDKLSDQSKKVITHYAYSLLLVGDIIEKKNVTTEDKTYEIVNARITYNKIPIVLSKDNKVTITNSKKDKEKTIDLQEFINDLKDVEKREDIIKW